MTLLAIPILGERPGLLRVVGGLVTLAGVYLAVREEVRGGRTRAEPVIEAATATTPPMPSNRA